MLDLETMSTKPNAAILSIGAVEFDLREKILRNEFYTRVSLESNMKMKRSIDANTVMWWMTQDDEARLELCKPAPRLVNVLVAFMDFLKNAGLVDRCFCVWGNGADFDNVILASAYSDCNYEVPWYYGNNRCFRTVKALYPYINYEKPLVAHNALEDAKAQARHVLKILLP